MCIYFQSFRLNMLSMDQNRLKLQYLHNYFIDKPTGPLVFLLQRVARKQKKSLPDGISKLRDGVIQSQSPVYLGGCTPKSPLSYTMGSFHQIWLLTKEFAIELISS